MEFGLDLIGSLRDRVGANSRRGTSGDGHDAPPLDWPGLHARLTAAYDARRALLDQAIGRSDALGSFDRRTAARISEASYASYLVNPTDLADCKVQSCIEADIAGSYIGDQGK